MDSTHSRDIDLRLPGDSLVCKLKLHAIENPPFTQFTASHALILFTFLQTFEYMYRIDKGPRRNKCAVV